MKWVLMMVVGCVVAGCVVQTQIPVPDATMAAESGQSLESLHRGHGLYVIHCGRCHEPIMPTKISDKDWHIVVPGMAWNAGISESDEILVMKYIHAVRGDTH